LWDVCHRLTALKKITCDLERTPFLSRLGYTGATPNAMEYYQLTAHREALFSLITPFVNLAYLFTLAETHKKPGADLRTVAVDAANGFSAAITLRKQIDAVADRWRDTMNKPQDHATAERLFYEIRDRHSLPAGNLTKATGEIIFFTFFYATAGIMRTPEDYLSGFNTHAGRLAAEAADLKKFWLEKILTAHDRRKLKTGKTKDYSGFQAAVLDMERRNLNVTKTWNGKRLFCAKKIFRELTNHHLKGLTAREARETAGDNLNFNYLARNNPLEIQGFEIFIEKTADDIAILQWDGDLDEIRLKIETFQNHILKHMTPA
jgi:hypothetical protein